MISSTDLSIFCHKDICNAFCPVQDLIISTNTNTRRRTQSKLSPTECRIFIKFNPFRTFHLSLHESVALSERFKMYAESLKV